MRFLAIIPARYGSSRFPGKPLVEIAGKPMIRHVYERASKVFPYCWVATDDVRIAHLVQEFGGRVVMTSSQHRSGTDRCCEALNKIQAETAHPFDVVVNIQGDEPFVATGQLEQIQEGFQHPATQITTLIQPFGDHEDIHRPDTPKVVIDKQGQALYFSRSVIPFIRGEAPQDWAKKHLFYKHIGLYGYRTNVLKEITSLPPGVLEQAESLEQLRWLENGYRIQTAVTHFDTHAIDTPEDLERVQHLFANHLHTL